jgi:hypothetical protein
MATLQTKASELSAGEIRYGTAKLEANLEARSHQSTARASFDSQSEYNAARKAESAAVASAETARANAAQVMVEMDLLQMRALAAQSALRAALNRREVALAVVSTH